MVKTKSEQTPAQKAADAARKAYSSALDAIGDKEPNAAQKANLDKLKAARDVAVKAENRERFLRVAPNRARKAATAIEGMAKAFNVKGYDFTADEANKLISGIQSRLDKAKAALAPATVTKAQTDEFAL